MNFRFETGSHGGLYPARSRTDIFGNVSKVSHSDDYHKPRQRLIHPGDRLRSDTLPLTVGKTESNDYSTSHDYDDDNNNKNGKIIFDPFNLHVTSIQSNHLHSTTLIQDEIRKDLLKRRIRSTKPIRLHRASPHIYQHQRLPELLPKSHYQLRAKLCCTFLRLTTCHSHNNAPQYLHTEKNHFADNTLPLQPASSTYYQKAAVRHLPRMSNTRKKQKKSAPTRLAWDPHHRTDGAGTTRQTWNGRRNRSAFDATPSIPILLSHNHGRLRINTKNIENTH